MYKFMNKIAFFLMLISVPLIAKAEMNTEVNASDSNMTEVNATLADGTMMLWEVGGEHEGRVYLFGSIHVGKPDLYPLDEGIIKAYRQSDYLVLETKNDEDSETAVNKAMYQDGRLYGNKTLKDLISEKNYERLQIKLKSLKMSPGSLDMFHPWVVSLVIAMTDIIKLGYSPQFGLDLYFEQKAQREGKPVFSIESPVEQLNIFAGRDDSFGEQMLELTLDTEPQNSGDIEKLFAKWKEGNTSFFEEEIIAPMEKFPEVKSQLLTERNDKMVKKVNLYRSNKKGKSYFVIVGLAHLLGTEGIIQQLKDQNLTVIRH